jgi:hypothetical protein
MRTSIFRAVYRATVPIIGNRAAIWIGELAPALLFAGIPLLLFWLLLSGPVVNRGADHQTCGSGPTSWDC